MKKLILAVVLTIGEIGLGDAVGFGDSNQLNFAADKHDVKTLNLAPNAGYKLISIPETNCFTRAGAGDLSGTWIFSFGDNYIDNYTGETFLAEYTCHYEDKGNYRFWVFNNPEEDYLPFVGLLNNTTSRFTIYADIIGSISFEGEMCYLSQEPFVFDPKRGDDGIIEWVEYIEADYDPEKGTLTYEPYNGIMWGVYGDRNDIENTFMGWLNAFDFEGATLTGDLGVGSIKSSDTYVEAEFFNLQGQRITSPQKGQILIRKQGGESYKLIF